MNTRFIVTAVLAITISMGWLTNQCEAQYRAGLKAKYLKIMTKEQAKQAEAQKAEADKRAAAIAAENKRKFEMHQKASKERNEKLEAERAAIRERLAKEAKASDTKQTDQKTPEKKEVEPKSKSR